MLRRAFVWLHRWVGLTMAMFLLIVGLTGSLLAFNSELERVFTPQLFAKPRPGVAALDLATLTTRAEALALQGRVTGVTLTEPDQASVSFEARENPATGQPYDLGFTELFVDPWTSEELGRRKRGDLSQGAVNLMPFIYDLHWRLALGDIGQWVLGIVALIWTIDCFVAFYLTLPHTLTAFWRRWKPAWLIKRRAGFYRLNFDLHRAGGLWLWAMLFIFAWSSVMMDWRPAYEFVTKAVFSDYRSPSYPLPRSASEKPALDWRAALARGERLISEQAALHDFTAGEPLSLSYVKEANAYYYEVRGSRDLFERSPKGGGTFVTFDGDSGALIELSQPTGEHAGNTVESWLYALHMARVFGLPYRIFVSLLGLAIVMLSVTGVYIWWKKRQARKKAISNRAGDDRMQATENIQTKAFS
jgi:uncharacterized iron-regulated membrane protein